MPFVMETSIALKKKNRSNINKKIIK